MSKEARQWHSRQVIPNGPMKSVLGVLAYLHQEGRKIYPSQAYLARETGLSREQLYRSFSEQGNPTLKTMLAVMRALGMDLTAKPHQEEPAA